MEAVKEKIKAYEQISIAKSNCYVVVIIYIIFFFPNAHFLFSVAAASAIAPHFF